MYQGLMTKPGCDWQVVIHRDAAVKAAVKHSKHRGAAARAAVTH